MRHKGFGDIGSKYGNKKVYVDGIKFDSKKEARRYQELLLLQKIDKIRDLVLQPKFEIIPTIRKKWLDKTLSKIHYIADFTYFDNSADKKIVEDVKGYKTAVYEIKKRLFIQQYGDEYEFRELK